MSKTFLGIVNDLTHVSSVAEKQELSVLASKKLEAREEYASNLLYPIVERIMMSYFDKQIEENFYEFYVVPYMDNLDNLLVSLRMTFLQKFDSYDPEFDEKLALVFHQELSKRNLDLLVNDICINMVQYKDGKKI